MRWRDRPDQTRGERLRRKTRGEDYEVEEKAKCTKGLCRSNNRKHPEEPASATDASNRPFCVLGGFSSGRKTPRRIRGNCARRNPAAEQQRGSAGGEGPMGRETRGYAEASGCGRDLTRASNAAKFGRSRSKERRSGRSGGRGGGGGGGGGEGGSGQRGEVRR